jgi:hypothetical protein
LPLRPFDPRRPSLFLIEEYVGRDQRRTPLPADTLGARCLRNEFERLREARPDADGTEIPSIGCARAREAGRRYRR